ncbi:DUF1801 domain-containing protein [Aquincola sp. S2]|uniref:DUF1801 domain-containing protein n=1 Tax=Pseudaquabacterium terrae TaxID=2732868 RepID=A0ABX2EK25_9BURK|nr:DUF1801 domain-containing protein [Aquabacterium terrae]NRF69006.1 DUF1801 domain-containing protein [Aquabacterium terrae]
MTNDRVFHLLEDIRLIDEARHALVDRLRRLVLSVDPSVTEEVKYAGLLFSAGPPFCGIFSYSRHVSLEFGRGSELADPHKVLEGEGKMRRHIKLENGDDLFRKNVREYVVAAFTAARAAELQHKRTTRR